MAVLIEVLVCTFKVIYYILEGIITTFIPSLQVRKTVSGQTVLITGAGKLFYLNLLNFLYLEHSIFKEIDSFVQISCKKKILSRAKLLVQRGHIRIMGVHGVNNMYGTTYDEYHFV